MDWLINNWYIVLGIIAVLVAVGVAIYKFAGLPTQEQIAKIRKWMLYAVIECEKVLGENTGEVKLRMCWDMFIARFPLVAKVISFDTFKFWVDQALDEMKELLETNEAVKNVVSGNTLKEAQVGEISAETISASVAKQILGIARTN